MSRGKSSRLFSWLRASPHVVAARAGEGQTALRLPGPIAGPVALRSIRASTAGSTPGSGPPRASAPGAPVRSGAQLTVTSPSIPEWYLQTKV